MTVALIAAVCMVVQDVLGTVMAVALVALLLVVGLQ